MEFEIPTEDDVPFVGEIGERARPIFGSYLALLGHPELNSGQVGVLARLAIAEAKGG